MRKAPKAAMGLFLLSSGANSSGHSDRLKEDTRLDHFDAQRREGFYALGKDGSRGWTRNKKLVVTDASLVVTSALLVVTRSY